MLRKAFEGEFFASKDTEDKELLQFGSTLVTFFRYIFLLQEYSRI